MDDQHVVRQCILQASRDGEPDFMLADPGSVEQLSEWVHGVIGLHFSLVRLPSELKEYLFALMGAKAMVKAEDGWAPIPDKKLAVLLMGDENRKPSAAKRQAARLRERLDKWQKEKKQELVRVRKGHGEFQGTDQYGRVVLKAVPTYYRLLFFEKVGKLMRDYQYHPEKVAGSLKAIAKRLEAELHWEPTEFDSSKIDPDRALRRIYSKIKFESKKAFELSAQVGLTDTDMQESLIDRVKESRTEWGEAVVED